MRSQSEAMLAKDTATLNAAETQAKRYASLLQDKLVSQEQNLQYSSAAETARETVKADRASVDSARATIELDQVAVDTARLNLSYCRIPSPINGRTGTLMVHQGNLVKPNDVALVVINRISPVNVSFNAPDRELDTIRKYAASGKLPVEAVSHENTAIKETGNLSLIENTVDTTTGTIKLKATFENPRRTLWPGQFVDVVLRLADNRDAVVIPGEAVQAGQKGSFVYVVKKDKTVEPRPVTVNRNVQDKVIIDSGLTAGETVVTDGQMMLFPGATVFVAKAPQAPGGAPAPAVKGTSGS
jgi:multidrug efflux system membrane fusion protein